MLGSKLARGSRVMSLLSSLTKKPKASLAAAIFELLPFSFVLQWPLQSLLRNLERIDVGLV